MPNQIETQLRKYYYEHSSYSLVDYYKGVLGILDQLFPHESVAETNLESEIARLDKKLGTLKNREPIDYLLRQMIWRPAFQSEGTQKKVWKPEIKSYLTEISQLAALTSEEIDRQSQSIPDSFKTGAVPPYEVMAKLREQGLSDNEIAQLGWYPVPALSHIDRRVSRAGLVANGQVDAFSLMEPYLNQTVLAQTLRTMDVGNGCGNHCDTCCVDSPFISKMFSYASLERLFYDDDFHEMLQPDSIRIGSSGDIMDYPNPAAIANMILQATKPLEQRRKRDGNHYEIKIFTNYRPIHAKKLDSLIELALHHKHRMKLVVSLPFNRTDIINRKFTEYVKSRGDFFRKGYYIDDGGLIAPTSLKTASKNFTVYDVRQTEWLFTCGRVLSDELRRGRIDKSNLNPGTSNVRARGLVKTYLNPDALWLMVYATRHESHTQRVFTPITLDNLIVLGKLQYHPDFPTPPNWPGSAGIMKSEDETKLLLAVMKNGRKRSKRRTIVG